MDDNIIAIKSSLLLQLKECATDSYQRFVRAFDLLKSDIDKAEKEFKNIANSAQFVLNSMDFYFSKFYGLNCNEELLYVSQLTNLIIKCYHNLVVISRNKGNTNSLTYGIKELLYKGELSFYYHLAYLYLADEMVLSVIDAYIKDINIEGKETAIGSLFLLDFVIRNNKVDLYYQYPLKDEYKHWFSVYQEIKDIDNEKLQSSFSRVGLYLNDNLDKLDVKRLIYHSVFFESIALTYSYTYKLNNEKTIIMNGYDSYLELETLKIIYENDFDFYVSLFNDLKVVCLERLIEKSAPSSLFRMTYGNEFMDDLYERSKKQLALIDKDNKNDYRNHSDRRTPEWVR